MMFLSFLESWSLSIKDSVLYCTNTPCIVCVKMLINAGITDIIYKTYSPSFKSSEVKHIIDLLYSLEPSFDIVAKSSSERGYMSTEPEKIPMIYQFKDGILLKPEIFNDSKNRKEKK